MPVRMKDIARDLGVSVITVSKVLRDHSDISDETKRRVRKRIRELNYRPNLAARALVTGRTYLIGFIVPDLIHPFFGQVAKGLSKVLRGHGYSLVISSSEEDAALEQDEIDHLLARRVDALILASTQATPEAFQRVAEQRVPYVLIDRKFEGFAAHFVGVDDNLIGYTATSHLVAQGRRRVAHIRGEETSTAAGRCSGYERALAENGLALQPDLVVRAHGADDLAEASGRSAMNELLALDPRPDAVFCYNDPIALGAMQAVLEASLRVPEDVAIVGSGNVNYAPLLRVPLSTVDQKSGELGERAAELVLSLIEADGPVEPNEILLEPELVVRSSS